MFEQNKKVLEERVRLVLQRIGERIYTPLVPLGVSAWHVHGEPVSPAHALAQDYKPFSVGDPWGGLWDTTWFRFQGRIPAEWAGKEVVALVRLTDFDYEGFTAEGLLYQDGRLKRAINANRREVDIATIARGGEPFEFFVEAAANGGSDKNGFLPGMCQPDYLGDPRYRLAQAQLACLNRELRAYYYDFKTAMEALETFPEDSQRRAELCRALNESVDAFDIGNGNLELARNALREVLSRKNGATAHTISGVGHAHIDTAWLWPLREAIRKCARTFSTALDYMEHYPEYVFACSQPQQYLWMKVRYPEIWEGIKKAVQRGQWEPVGSMWIEADCNLASGESLVRQLLYGKRFFMREFGVETRDVWLPDVFGYPGTLPQIFRQAGVEYFMTQKLSWNQFNPFPHHTFRWEGVDGSKVFTHFPPAANYNADTGAKDLQKTVSNFREHGRLTRSLLLYGYGDGGGGPSIEMLEKARRLRDFEGLPKLELEKASAFFEKAEGEATEFPEWVGELYLELHRGTFTTQAKTKLGNRRSEFLLRDAEFFDSFSRVLNPASKQRAANPARAIYDVTGLDSNSPEGSHKAALERAWKLVLLNQFHDIIPGSSIHWVYEDSARDYATVLELGESVRDSAWSAVANLIDTGGLKEPAIVANTLGFERTEVVDLPNGNLAVATVPACGYSALDLAAFPPSLPKHPVKLMESASGIILENGLVRLAIDREGYLGRIEDLRLSREVLEPGQQGNVFCLHNDIPSKWDAWEVDIAHRESYVRVQGLEKISVVENSPLRCSVEVTRGFGKSHITQRIILKAGTPRIDFATEVDWREDRKFLKVAFPVNVRSSRATYDIQFGHIERPTHANTSWDMAKFEVCAHKWADLSEPGFGVSLLNDCKYGYDIHGNTLRLSLLRAPISPDPLADRGHHRFTYSLLSHGGDFRAGRVIEEAYSLNSPLWIQPAVPSPGSLPLSHSFLKCDSPAIVIEAVKKAEDGDALIIRMYESHGTRGNAKLNLGFPAGKACWTDCLEREEQPASLVENVVSFPFRPFEILTLKLEGFTSGVKN